jgi:hypothetical protein
MSVKKCKKIGHDFHIEQIFDNFDEVNIILKCERCNGEVDVYGDVRGDDGRYIEYHLDDEEEE